MMRNVAAPDIVDRAHDILHADGVCNGGLLDDDDELIGNGR